MKIPRHFPGQSCRLFPPAAFCNYFPRQTIIHAFQSSGLEYSDLPLPLPLHYLLFPGTRHVLLRVVAIVSFQLIRISCVSIQRESVQNKSVLSYSCHTSPTHENVCSNL